jgi:hypothetical protein
MHAFLSFFSRFTTLFVPQAPFLEANIYVTKYHQNSLFTILHRNLTYSLCNNDHFYNEVNLERLEVLVSASEKCLVQFNSLKSSLRLEPSHCFFYFLFAYYCFFFSIYLFFNNNDCF